MYHEPADAQGRYLEDLERIVALQPPWLSIARRAGGLRNAVRIFQEAARTRVARGRGARPLIKDPFSLLLTEWIARSVDAHVVVLVRHPAAFASSVKRLGWRFDPTWLLDQPALMGGDLAPFQDALETDRRRENDLIDHAVLMWRVLNSVVARYEAEHPDWQVLRYEDLAIEPTTGFQVLFDALDVPWDAEVAAAIARATSADQISEVPADSAGGTQRNSRAAMRTWVGRLTAEEIARIREGTRDVASRWYEERDWLA